MTLTCVCNSLRWTSHETSHLALLWAVFPPYFLSILTELTPNIVALHYYVREITDWSSLITFATRAHEFLTARLWSVVACCLMETGWRLLEVKCPEREAGRYTSYGAGTVFCELYFGIEVQKAYEIILGWWNLFQADPGWYIWAANVRITHEIGCNCSNAPLCI